ncbi:MAG TPA: SOS response-associated peptidase [Stellaceae bacterium]|nr:SOS response-associated peptidase [Stellaceae bacterium]
MCGRARLSSDTSELRRVFGIPPEAPIPNVAANWNAAPTQDLPVVRYDAEEKRRSLEIMRWGLVPFWAKDAKIGYSTFNAKAEGIAQKPTFREPFRKRRCLVPFDSFYEWKKAGKTRQPYAVAPADGGLFAMAGLWDLWRSPAGETVRSFTIVTTAANALLAPLHERMPVILDPEDWPLWLGEVAAEPARLEALLRPCPPDRLAVWPVSPRVGNVRNNDPALVEPIAQNEEIGSAT